MHGIISLLFFVTNLYAVFQWHLRIYLLHLSFSTPTGLLIYTELSYLFLIFRSSAVFSFFSASLPTKVHPWALVPACLLMEILQSKTHCIEMAPSCSRCKLFLSPLYAQGWACSGSLTFSPMLNIFASLPVYHCTSFLRGIYTWINRLMCGTIAQWHALWKSFVLCEKV